MFFISPSLHFALPSTTLLLPLPPLLRYSHTRYENLTLLCRSCKTSCHRMWTSCFLGRSHNSEIVLSRLVFIFLWYFSGHDLTIKQAHRKVADATRARHQQVQHELSASMEAQTKEIEIKQAQVTSETQQQQAQEVAELEAEDQRLGTTFS